MPSVDKIRYMKSVCVGAHTILVREDTGLAERVLHLRKSNGPPHRTLTTQPTVLGALPNSTGSLWLTTQHRQLVTHPTGADVRVSEDIVAEEAEEHLWGLLCQDNDLLRPERSHASHMTWEERLAHWYLL